jgi:2-amino-4-hydroxy-6-hydroxymethyldihydropteridine diphosphokinase
MLFHLNLGSNIDPRDEHLRNALALLEKSREVSVVGCSRIYETPAVGIAPPAGPFLNCCVALRSSLRAEKLLERAHEIELLLGRPASSKGACVSRIIDIDIVLAEHLVVDTPALRIPHPELTRRSFFLWPLLEICPGATDPRDEKALKYLLGAEVAPPILQTLPAPRTTN